MTRDLSLTPTMRTLAFAAALSLVAALPALGAGSAWPLWLAALGSLLTLAGLDAFLVPRANRLRLDISIPERVAIGGDAAVEVRVASPQARHADAEATLDLEPLFAPVDIRKFRLGREAGAVRLPLVALRRGRARVEALWLRHPGPLGLMRRTVRHRIDAEVAAVPDLALVQRTALAAVSSRSAPVGAKVERFAGAGSEFHALRGYVPGLDLRTIDWKASARHRRLLAREVRAEHNHQIILAVDTGRLMAEPLDGVPLLDHAIHAALGLAWVALDHGDQVGFYAFDQRGHTYSGPRTGTRSLPALIERSSGLEYADVETNFTLSLSTLASHLRRRALVIVLTDFVDSVTAELMVENVSRLARRHLVVFVAFRDPALDAIALAQPQDLETLERAAVADQLIQGREVVLRRLGRAGITVIDAVPSMVGARLIDRYLEITRREMI